MSVAETLVLDDAINIVVLSDMELRLSTQYVAREGDHNSAVFRIVRQPLALDQLVCRAEIETAQGKNYYLVVDGEFALTQDIAVAGPGRMQLVYSDGVEIMRKTSIAHFTVMPSINAVDPSDPDFQDGLAQLATAAFAAVTADNTGFAFFNVAGQGVGFVPWPIGSGGALDEATANTLYLRLNGANEMTGNIIMMLPGGQSRGILFDPDNNLGMMYADGTSIRFRRAQGNADLTIENADGSTGTRSPILTALMGDARYLTIGTADARYLQLAGGILTGNLFLLPNDSADTPIGITIGGRQARVRWDGALILTRGAANEPVQIENNNGTNRSDIITQLSGDARYAMLSGAQMTGPLITAPGGSVTNPGLAIGDNSTGFFRTGSTLLLSVSGQLYAQYLGSPPSMMMVVPINMATQTIQSLGDPRDGAPGAQDAVNRRTMEAAVANVPRPNSRTYLTNTVELSTTPQILIDQLYPVPNNNLRTITVTVFPSFMDGTSGAFYDLIYTCSVAPLIEARSTCYPTAGAYMASPVRFAATVTPAGNAIQVQIAVRLNAAQPNPLSIIGSGTDKRSYVTIEEQAN